MSEDPEQSAIVWGKFEEITEMEEKQTIIQKLNDRITPLSLMIRYRHRMDL